MLRDLSPKFPVVAVAIALGAANFPHMSVVPVTADVECLDAVLLHRTDLLM